MHAYTLYKLWKCPDPDSDTELFIAPSHRSRNSEEQGEWLAAAPGETHKGHIGGGVC